MRMRNVRFAPNRRTSTCLFDHLIGAVRGTVIPSKVMLVSHIVV